MILLLPAISLIFPIKSKISLKIGEAASLFLLFILLNLAEVSEGLLIFLKRGINYLSIFRYESMQTIFSAFFCK